MALESREIEEQVAELEERIDRLRALYEQYFMGLEKIEPQIPRKDVDRRLWVLRREQIRNTGLRFKFHMLVQRYNSFQQYWGRVSREIENGTYKRDVLRAAKRFGEREVLTAVGRKRADLYKKLADTQRANDAERDAAPEPGAPPTSLDALLSAAMNDALVVADDELPTPAPPRAERASLFTVANRPAPRPAPAAPVRSDHPGAIAAAPSGERPSLDGSSRRQPSSGGSSDATPEPSAPNAKPSGGLRWRPAESEAKPDAVKRKVAALASALRRERGDCSSADQVDRLALDLELDSRRPLPPSHGPPPLPVVPKAAPPPAIRPPASPRAEPLSVSRGPTAQEPGARSEAKSQAAEAQADARRPSWPVLRQPRATQVQPPAPPGRAAPTRPVPAPVEDARIRQIYAKYVESRRATNESTAGLTYEKLAESLHAQTNKLRTRHPDRKVDYEVVVKDGKTILKPVLR